MINVYEKILNVNYEWTFGTALSKENIGTTLKGLGWAVLGVVTLGVLGSIGGDLLSDINTADDKLESLVENHMKQNTQDGFLSQIDRSPLDEIFNIDGLMERLNTTTAAQEAAENKLIKDLIDAGKITLPDGVTADDINITDLNTVTVTVGSTTTTTNTLSYTINGTSYTTDALTTDSVEMASANAYNAAQTEAQTALRNVTSLTGKNYNIEDVLNKSTNFDAVMSDLATKQSEFRTNVLEDLAKKRFGLSDDEAPTPEQLGEAEEMYDALRNNITKNGDVDVYSFTAEDWKVFSREMSEERIADQIQNNPAFLNNLVSQNVITSEQAEIIKDGPLKAGAGMLMDSISNFFENEGALKTVAVSSAIGGLAIVGGAAMGNKRNRSEMSNNTSASVNYGQNSIVMNTPDNMPSFPRIKRRDRQ